MNTWQSTFPTLGCSSTSGGWDWSVSNPSAVAHCVLVESAVLLQITRDGRIVDEGIIRVNNARKEHKARSKGVLATSIINRAIEIEVNILYQNSMNTSICPCMMCTYRESAEVS